jgi:large subunit ribosomal protein L15
MDLNLSNLKPAQARKARKRVGRGLGSGKGRYSGRGIKCQKSRSGSNKMRPGFEGGQNPIYMRLAKQRGPYSKDAMPMGPHRTSTIPVNVAALEERFDAGAEVTIETLIEKGLVRNARTDVKLLGNGGLSKKLSITVHAASATAREKVEAAGGSLTLLREPKVRHPKRRPKSAAPAEPEPEAEAEAEETEPEAEAAPEEEPAEGGEEG